MMSSNYPPQQGWGQPPTTPAPKRKRRPGVLGWIGIAILAFVAFGIAATLNGENADTATSSINTIATEQAPESADSDPSADSGIGRGLGSADASADVTLGDLKLVDDGFGTSHVEAIVTVHNNSEGRSDYYIEAQVFDKDGVNIGMTNAVVNSLEPGADARQKLESYDDGAHEIKITEIQRTESS